MTNLPPSYTTSWDTTARTTPLSWNAHMSCRDRGAGRALAAWMLRGPTRRAMSGCLMISGSGVTGPNWTAGRAGSGRRCEGLPILRSVR